MEDWGPVLIAGHPQNGAHAAQIMQQKPFDTKREKSWILCFGIVTVTSAIYSVYPSKFHSSKLYF